MHDGWKLALAMMSLLLVSFRTAGCGEAAPLQQKEQPSMQAQLQFRAEIKPSPDALEISYSVTNPSDQHVLIFDRFWDPKTQALDPAWANVEIRGTKALISRNMTLKPVGLSTDEPPVPYGRELAPGAKLEGKFRVPLPLEERNGYYARSHATREWKEMEVSEVAFALGWGVKPPSLPPAIQPVDVEGEKALLLLPYGSVAQIQKLLISDPVRVKIVGRGRR